MIIEERRKKRREGRERGEKGSCKQNSIIILTYSLLY